VQTETFETDGVRVIIVNYFNCIVINCILLKINNFFINLFDSIKLIRLILNLYFISRIYPEL
jgi:uncharacterized protein YkuJ